MTSEFATESNALEFLRRVFVDGARYFLAFLVPLALSLVLTPAVRSLVKRLGMIDKPDPRRINKVPVPRGGGLAIFLAFNLTMVGMMLAGGNRLSANFGSNEAWAFLAASCLLATIGFIDDKFGMKPIVKLIGQIAVANILIFAGFHIRGIVVHFPWWLDYTLTLFWIVGAINAFNLIDGMDGLASGLAFIASAGMAGALLFAGDTSDTIPYLILAGACLGFLRYNFHPASIFLGDTGSMLLGMCLSTLPLVTNTRRELVASLGVPLLIMGIPIFDTFLAIWRRTVKRLLPNQVVDKLSSGVMQPDKDHIHHRILRAFMNNQRKAAWALYALAFGLVVLGLSGTVMSGYAPGLFFIVFIVLSAVVIRNFECVELINTGKLLLTERLSRRRYLSQPLIILCDILLLFFAWLSAWLLTMDEPFSRKLFFNHTSTFIAAPLIGMSVLHVYRRLWSRAQVRDFLNLAFAIMGGSVVAVGVLWLRNGDSYHLVRFGLSFMCFAFILASLPRMRREILFAISQILTRKVLAVKSTATPTLLYGAGMRLRGYLREAFESTSGSIPKEDMYVVGVLDDNPLLRGRIIAGYPVLGTGADLERVIAECRVKEVVVTCVMSSEAQKAIAARLRALGVPGKIWMCEERLLSDESAPRAH